MSRPKTNALRLLDDAGISYEVAEYDLSDEEFSAEAVADQLGMERDQVFKTLLAVGDDGPTFAVVPAGSELDLKALASVRGERKMSMVPVAELQRLTGYSRGAVTVLGAKRTFPTVLDDMATVHDRIAVSAGARGLQVVIGSEAYRVTTGAIIADIGR